MILAKSAILEEIRLGNLRIDPTTDETFQPASLDVRLGDEFLFPIRTRQPLGFDDRLQAFELGEQPMVAQRGTISLGAGSFCLARTVERIFIADHMAGWVEGRSSVGRGGLFIQNAGWIDPGFDGTITLELYNANPNPMILVPGRRIAQIVVTRVEGQSGGYHGKYQGQVRTTASAFYNDSEVAK